MSVLITCFWIVMMYAIFIVYIRQGQGKQWNVCQDGWFGLFLWHFCWFSSFSFALFYPSKMMTMILILFKWMDKKVISKWYQLFGWKNYWNFKSSLWRKASLCMIFLLLKPCKIRKFHHSWHVHNNFCPDLMAVLSKIWGL